MGGVCILKVVCCPSYNFKSKYNARDFDKSKSANLLKILKGEHPTKKWQNCGTEVLCVMIFYDYAELARIVNKVLGNDCLFHAFFFVGKSAPESKPSIGICLF